MSIFPFGIRAALPTKPRDFLVLAFLVLCLVSFLMPVHVMVVVHVIYGLPIVSLIFRNYFANIPDEMVEAARIDGAGLVRIFTNVMLPLSLPAFVVVAIFQFTNIWNDFLFGVTILPNPQSQPVTVALNNLSGSFSVDWNVVMAGAITAALPTALVFIFLGRS